MVVPDSYLFNKTKQYGAKHQMATLFLTRSLSTLSPHLRPFIAVSPKMPRCSPAATAARGFASPPSPPPTPSLCDGPSLPYGWSDHGLDFEHWMVVLGGDPPPEATREEVIDDYVKTLAKVVGSEEEATRRIYSVYTKFTCAFGVLASEELANRIGELDEVEIVVPDSYKFIETKQYPGEPFINGQVGPFDEKYYTAFLRKSVYKRPTKLEVASSDTDIGTTMRENGTPNAN